VSHKDVERRIQMMRKEQIRNTGLRFRFQMLIQRYNTYQSYWIRITRQIEEGTYKRDVVRAKKRIEKTERARVSEAPESIEVFVSEPPPALEDEPPTTKMTRPDAIKLELDDFKDLGAQPRAEAPKPAAPKVPPSAGSKPVVPVAPPSVSIPGARPVWRKVGEGMSAAPPAPATTLKPAPAATMTIKPATPAVSIKPAAPAVSIKPAAPAVSIKPAAPAVSRPPPVPTRPSAAAPPQQAPAAKPQPAPPPPAAKPQPAAPAPPAAVAKKPGDISEDRMRQLYSDFVETKRSQKESTASVTYDALARTIRDSTAKLKEKHAGKSVDFEVTVKDGKTILKPVVK
jgi:hypothetical protein